MAIASLSFPAGCLPTNKTSRKTLQPSCSVLAGVVGEDKKRKVKHQRQSLCLIAHKPYLQAYMRPLEHLE